MIRRVGGEHRSTIDLIMEAGEFLLTKVAYLYTECFQECTVPET